MAGPDTDWRMEVKSMWLATARALDKVYPDLSPAIRERIMGATVDYTTVLWDALEDGTSPWMDAADIPPPPKRCETCGNDIEKDATGQPGPSAGDHDPAYHIARTYHIRITRAGLDGPVDRCASDGEAWPCQTARDFHLP